MMNGWKNAAKEKKDEIAAEAAIHVKATWKISNQI
jgi:hypothetical protein